MVHFCFLSTRASSSSPAQNAHDEKECCRFFSPHLLSLFASPFYFQMATLHVSSTSFSSKSMTCVCMGMCVHVYVCVPASSSFPLLLSLTLALNPPTTTTPPPPIIEADSASQACTRHTRWLQQLERSLGHYSSPHYGKRRRGREEEEEEEQLR